MRLADWIEPGPWCWLSTSASTFLTPTRQPSYPGPGAKTRCLWMVEELVEFLEAEDLVDQVDAMMDLIYLALGTLVEMGVKPAGPFNVVHATNLTKVPQGVKGSDLGKAVKVLTGGTRGPHCWLNWSTRPDLAGEEGLDT